MKVTLSAWSWAFTVMMSSLAAHLNRKNSIFTKNNNLNLLQDLGHAVKVHSHGKLPVASELVKTIMTKVHSNKGNVAVVHGLELDTRVTAVPCGLLEQVLDGLQDLLEQTSLDKTCLKHFVCFGKNKI